MTRSSLPSSRSKVWPMYNDVTPGSPQQPRQGLGLVERLAADRQRQISGEKTGDQDAPVADLAATGSGWSNLAKTKRCAGPVRLRVSGE